MHLSGLLRCAAVVAMAFTVACHSSAGSPAGAGDMPPADGPVVAASSMEQAGEYLTTVGSCNDCHTQGWTESEGKIAPSDRFAGMNVGFRGPWGTSYGKNLRTIVQRQSEDRWVQTLKTSDGGDG